MPDLFVGVSERRGEEAALEGESMMPGRELLFYCNCRLFCGVIQCPNVFLLSPVFFSALS